MTGGAALPHREEASVLLDAPIEAVFAYLDDFHRLSAHMERRSGMMAGSSMTIEMDAGEGHAVGSQVRMRGRMMGIHLALTEVVTDREPPMRKAWRTIDAELLVIGNYRLGFDLAPEGRHTRVRFFIDYALPGRMRWLGILFARGYARWCIGRMAADASRQFAPRA